MGLGRVEDACMDLLFAVREVSYRMQVIQNGVPGDCKWRLMEDVKGMWYTE